MLMVPRSFLDFTHQLECHTSSQSSEHIDLHLLYTHGTHRLLSSAAEGPWRDHISTVIVLECLWVEKLNLCSSGNRFLMGSGIFSKQSTIRFTEPPPPLAAEERCQDPVRLGAHGLVN